MIDLVFLGANMLKVFQGGWVPLLIGAMVMVVMLTWRRGARILAAKTRRMETPIDGLIESLEKKKQLCRVPGTAVFLTADPDSAPTALLHSLKHYKVLHEHNVDPDHDHGNHAARVGVGARAASSLSAVRFSASFSASVSWRRRMCRRRLGSRAKKG